MMNLKRVLLAILMLLLSASFALSSLAQEKTGDGQVDLTAEERAFLAGKQLRLGVDVVRPPFEYVNEKGAYTGISAEFITAAAKRLGVTLVPMKEIKWTEAMEKVKVGEIDVIPKVTPSAAREKFLIFTKPYTTFPSVIITRKDLLAGGMDDLRGLKVGVNKGQIVEANLKRDHPGLSLVPYPDIETGLRALATGQCDAYIDNLGAVAYTIDTVGLTNLRIAASTPYTHDLAFGVRKDWPLLASSLDKALASMTDQEKTEIKNRWLAIKYDAVINWRIVGPIGAAMFVVIAFVLVWNRRLRKAVREREHSEQKITAMGEAMPDALVMIDGKGKVLFWNQAAETLFGYTAAEAMGMDFHAISVPPELREKAHAGVRQFGATGQGAVFGATIESTAMNRAGLAFPVEVNISPFRVDEEWLAVGTVRDITQRKQMDEKLKKSNESLQNQIGELGKTRKAMLNILEDLEVSRKEAEATMQKINVMSQAVYDALVMIDGQGKIQFWNQGAVKLFGYSVEEAMGMDFHAMAVPPELLEKAQTGIVQFAATGQGVLFGNTIETTAINRKSLIFPVEVNLSPFQLDGKWFAVGTVRDITERKQAEKELKERMEDLERFSRLTINREEKMIQLKEEINALQEQMGKEKRYKIVV